MESFLIYDNSLETILRTQSSYLLTTRLDPSNDFILRGLWPLRLQDQSHHREDKHTVGQQSLRISRLSNTNIAQLQEHRFLSYRLKCKLFVSFGNHTIRNNFKGELDLCTCVRHTDYQGIIYLRKGFDVDNPLTHVNYDKYTHKYKYKDKMLKRPNMCYIFERQGVQGPDQTNNYVLFLSQS